RQADRARAGVRALRDPWSKAQRPTALASPAADRDATARTARHGQPLAQHLAAPCLRAAATIERAIEKARGGRRCWYRAAEVPRHSMTAVVLAAPRVAAAVNRVDSAARGAR